MLLGYFEGKSSLQGWVKLLFTSYNCRWGKFQSPREHFEEEVEWIWPDICVTADIGGVLGSWKGWGRWPPLTRISDSWRWGREGVGGKNVWWKVPLAKRLLLVPMTLDSSSSSSSSASDVEEGKCKEVEDLQKFLQAETTMGMIKEWLKSGHKELDR